MINNTEKIIPLFDEVKLQAQILVPLINELRLELDKKKADELISKAIRPYVRSVYHKIGERKTGEQLEKWEKVWDEIRHVSVTMSSENISEMMIVLVNTTSNDADSPSFLRK